MHRNQFLFLVVALHVPISALGFEGAEHQVLAKQCEEMLRGKHGSLDGRNDVGGAPADPEKYKSLEVLLARKLRFGRSAEELEEKSLRRLLIGSYCEAVDPHDVKLEHSESLANVLGEDIEQLSDVKDASSFSRLKNAVTGSKMTFRTDSVSFQNMTVLAPFGDSYRIALLHEKKAEPVVKYVIYDEIEGYYLDIFSSNDQAQSAINGPSYYGKDFFKIEVLDIGECRVICAGK